MACTVGEVFSSANALPAGTPARQCVMQPYRPKHTMKANIAMTNAQMAP